MTFDAYEYVGGELELFEGAKNWKRYWGDLIRPFLGPVVAEVGAGIGANAVQLSKHCARWLCIEPDARLAARIQRRKSAGELDSNCSIVITSLAGLASDMRFDTILYADVLEHIADDHSEVSEAAIRLNPGGYLVVLAPAHQWLYTPFDSAVGHVRRYTIARLRSLSPPALHPRCFRYLDSIGLMASLANAVILRSANPTAGQIQFWDRLMVPVSRRVDRITRFRVGKSVLAVWQAPVTQVVR